MRRILCGLDRRIFVVTCRLVGAVKSARRKDARHLLHIAAAVKRDLISLSLYTTIAIAKKVVNFFKRYKTSVSLDRMFQATYSLCEVYRFL